MVGILADFSAKALDFIFLLDIDDLILLFKLKFYQYSSKAFIGSSKAFTGSVNIINQ